jgi:hypothetical protein
MFMGLAIWALKTRSKQPVSKRGQCLPLRRRPTLKAASAGRQTMDPGNTDPPNSNINFFDVTNSIVLEIVPLSDKVDENVLYLARIRDQRNFQHCRSVADSVQ